MKEQMQIKVKIQEDIEQRQRVDVKRKKAPKICKLWVMTDEQFESVK